jgi:biotin synthase-related radical SAM superfamily protein
LTSGVFPDNAEVIKKMCCIIRGVKRVNPSVSVGVEPCIFKREEILSLKEAGADEIKINLQVPDRDLFKKVCPDFDYDGVLDMLHEAVEVFGRGKVASNIIYGLGESDVTIVNILEKLAKIGVVPTLRKIRINMLNQGKLEKAISNKPDEVSVDRILKIAYRHRKVLEKYHLTTTTFDTMCHRCGCCDIVPFWDI